MCARGGSDSKRSRESSLYRSPFLLHSLSSLSRSLTCSLPLSLAHVLSHSLHRPCLQRRLPPCSSKLLPIRPRCRPTPRSRPSRPGTRAPPYSPSLARLTDSRAARSTHQDAARRRCPYQAWLPAPSHQGRICWSAGQALARRFAVSVHGSDQSHPPRPSSARTIDPSMTILS